MWEGSQENQRQRRQCSSMLRRDVLQVEVQRMCLVPKVSSHSAAAAFCGPPVRYRSTYLYDRTISTRQDSSGSDERQPAAHRRCAAGGAAGAKRPAWLKFAAHAGDVAARPRKRRPPAAKLAPQEETLPSKPRLATAERMAPAGQLSGQPALFSPR